jgi:hypothetical protein
VLQPHIFKVAVLASKMKPTESHNTSSVYSSRECWKVGSSSILDEYQANNLLDVATHTEFYDNCSTHHHYMVNEVGHDQINITNCCVIFAGLPHDIIQLSRIVLKLMIVWLIVDIGRTIGGAFK